MKVRAPGFDGEFKCTIQVAEWHQFVQVLRDLQNAIGSDAQGHWANMEENIELHFTLTRQGAIEGAYRLSPENFGVGPVLTGSFEADQTFLARWLQEAEEVSANAR